MTGLERAADAAPPYSDHDLLCLDHLDRRLQWLSAWTIHHANHIRENRDGLKVGGHQASCASMTTIMAALYFHILRPEDRVAVKPHAGPVFHAIQYLFGNQSQDQLERFRAFGGEQSYPSRTKDQTDVDFSTGSVGLGVAITAFASLTQDYLIGHGWRAPEKRGRMISLLGDAELDEGNIYEALLESAKHDIRNTWWIVDFNRQSLDAVSPEHMADRLQGIFFSAGWTVQRVRYGRLLRGAFEQPGGDALKTWLDQCPNDLYSALTYEGGGAWRAALQDGIPGSSPIWRLLSALDDDGLAALMTNLGGHCMATLLDTFHTASANDAPRFFLCDTIKGHNLPFQGHKDNHAGLMTPDQIETFRKRMGVAKGAEWEPLAGLPDNARAHVSEYIARAPFAAEKDRRYSAPQIDVPGRDIFPSAFSASISTQAAFGRVLQELARHGGPLAERIVTTSPDVTVSTNLGSWVNARGLFGRDQGADLFRDRKIASPQRWGRTPQGQHIELGIAEHNLFLLLGALGLSHGIFGERLIPVGTLYDPFIARGLDALNYACYQDARFLLAATPSGITLGPEGGAHQSISTPLIGMGQPGLTYYEPAYGTELAVIMRWAFEHLQAEDGGSVYLRLSTRAIDQTAPAIDEMLERAILDGAYWRAAPKAGAPLAIVYTGAIAPEALEAFAQLEEDVPEAGLLAVTSPDRLHTDWRASLERPFTGRGPQTSWIARLLGQLAPDAVIVTVHDGAPGALSWLGSVHGQRVVPLGVDRFGQTGGLPDLYKEYRLDADAILDACASGLVGIGRE